MPVMSMHQEIIVKKCSHTWYMREAGITCTKCGEIWESDEDNNLSNL
jgi:hypothetical protein